MENTYKAIARNIKHYLELQNMTQDQLAQKLGVSNQAVSYWCSGKRAPRLDKIDKMCEIFNCKRSDLISNVNYTYTTASGESVGITFEVEQKESSPKWMSTNFRPKAEDYMSFNDFVTIVKNIEAASKSKRINSSFSHEHMLLRVYRQLNDSGRQKVFNLAVELLKDPNYQSEELIKETKEMFQKYMEAGLLKEAGSDDN